MNIITYHQGCSVNGHLCKLNQHYNGCEDCPRYIIPDEGGSTDG